MNNAKKLSLAHLETASILLPRIDEEGGIARIVALYNASAHEAVEFRTNPEVLTPYITEANCLGWEESMEVVEYFFGCWQKFQNSILTSAGVSPEVLEKVKTSKLAEILAPPPATH